MNVFISPLFLKDSFTKYRIIHRQFFFLPALWICHPIIASSASDENAVLNHIDVYVASYFSPDFQDFCLENRTNLSFNKLTMLFLGTGLFVFILLNY